MEIKKIEEPFSICKVKDYSKVDLQDTFSFVAKTDEELSLVCLTQSVPEHHRKGGRLESHVNTREL